MNEHCACIHFKIEELLMFRERAKDRIPAVYSESLEHSSDRYRYITTYPSLVLSHWNIVLTGTDALQHIPHWY